MSKFEKKETRAVNRGFRIKESIDDIIRETAKVEGVTYSHVANVLLELGLENIKTQEADNE